MNLHDQLGSDVCFAGTTTTSGAVVCDGFSELASPCQTHKYYQVLVPLINMTLLIIVLCGKSCLDCVAKAPFNPSTSLFQF